MSSPTSLAEEVRAGHRAAVSRAITLVESSLPEHRSQARELLAALGTPAAQTVRVGISGVPGVGKSTFIETLGRRLTAAGHRVGVLAVDPSSQRTGGSVLGDKTRMPELATDPRAYIRASPSAGTLGGVARATSQALLVLEAASYDVVLIETVGVGQSETTVAGMVDTFLYLTLARTGDQLQGIKRGILEIADVIAVNKADGDRRTEAEGAARELAGALRMVRGRGAWSPSGGHLLRAHRRRDRRRLGAGAGPSRAAGPDGLAEKRTHQQLDFAWALVRDELEQRLRRSPSVRRVRAQVREQVLSGELAAVTAADRILAAYDADPGGGIA